MPFGENFNLDLNSIRLTNILLLVGFGILLLCVIIHYLTSGKCEKKEGFDTNQMVNMRYAEQVCKPYAEEAQKQCEQAGGTTCEVQYHDVMDSCLNGPPVPARLLSTYSPREPQIWTYEDEMPSTTASVAGDATGESPNETPLENLVEGGA